MRHLPYDLNILRLGGWPARALTLLCDHLVAYETDIRIHYEMAAAEAAFRLGEGEQAAVLGFTTAGIWAGA